MFFSHLQVSKASLTPRHWNHLIRLQQRERGSFLLVKLIWDTKNLENLVHACGTPKEMFWMMRWILLDLSPVDVAKQNGTAWSTWRAFKSYQIIYSSIFLIDLPFFRPDYSQPTSPWKKCTGVAGSSAGSLLPTKELSTNTAPQDGSSSTQSRDDVIKGFRFTTSKYSLLAWQMMIALFSASMLDLKAVKPWISREAKCHNPSYILKTSESNLLDRFHWQFILSPPSASCEVPAPKAASKTTAPPCEKPANTTRSELRPASNCSWRVLIYGKTWWNSCRTRSCSCRLVLHTARTNTKKHMKRLTVTQYISIHVPRNEGMCAITRKLATSSSEMEVVSCIRRRT